MYAIAIIAQQTTSWCITTNTDFCGRNGRTFDDADEGTKQDVDGYGRGDCGINKTKSGVYNIYYMYLF